MIEYDEESCDHWWLLAYPPALERWELEEEDDEAVHVDDPRPRTRQ